MACMRTLNADLRSREHFNEIIQRAWGFNAMLLKVENEIKARRYKMLHVSAGKACNGC